LAAILPDINQELIGLCLRGDRVAQYRLYKQYSRSMYNLCLRMISDRSEAEDILQEAFEKVFRELPSFRGQSTLGAWLRRIVINQCLNHIRKQRPVFETLDDQELPADEEQDVDLSEITADEINESIMRLPAGARVVCVLHLLEGFRHAEISGLLGISESTSKSQYRRSISLLQQRLTTKIYAGKI
jgi:RNA polymerase sigma factor (sigma-70 family)